MPGLSAAASSRFGFGATPINGRGLESFLGNGGGRGEVGGAGFMQTKRGMFNEMLKTELDRVHSFANGKTNTVSKRSIAAMQSLRRVTLRNSHDPSDLLITQSQVTAMLTDVSLLLWFTALNLATIKRLAPAYKTMFSRSIYSDNDVVLDGRLCSVFRALLSLRKKLEHQKVKKSKIAHDVQKALLSVDLPFAELALQEGGGVELRDSHVSPQRRQPQVPMERALSVCLPCSPLQSPRKFVDVVKPPPLPQISEPSARAVRVLKNLPRDKPIASLSNLYKIGKVAGRGAYGCVYSAVCKRTGAHVAIKTIAEPFEMPIFAQRVYREVAVLRRMQHEHTIGLIDMHLSQNTVHLVFPFIQRTLESLLLLSLPTANTPPSFRFLPIQKKLFMSQLLDTLCYLHYEEGVVHRDLKLSNILVDVKCKPMKIYLSDFGSARTLVRGGAREHMIDCPGYVQTQWYRAPEILLCGACITPSADMWSYGCIIAELVSGVPLLPGQDSQHQLELVIDATGIPSVKDVKEIGPKSVGILQRSGFLSGEPSADNTEPQTASLEVMLKDCVDLGGGRDEISPEVVDIIARCLTFSANKRMTAKEACSHAWLSAVRKPFPPPRKTKAKIPAKTPEKHATPTEPCYDSSMNSDESDKDKEKSTEEEGMVLPLSCAKLYTVEEYKMGVCCEATEAKGNRIDIPKTAQRRGSDKRKPTNPQQSGQDGCCTVQ